MNIRKTVKTKLKKTAKGAGKDPNMGHTQNLSSTMSIPLVSMIEEIDLKSSAYLDILLTGQPQRRIELGRGEITIGRDEDCSIQLPITNVSRKHACLFPKGEDFIVEDLSSTNGTFVNGVKISRCVLRNNDMIRIGEARIQFIQQKFRV
ncbi:MAG: hypothetical protein A2283_19705 [Lentisphaerae bacterium RIFOXYA12_FULL_48_11]|nr:MAG: hypothetical protein A2283_19705 [Lentisphaerae bacterium RIFOXYA12_FULL_48_11]